MHCNPIKASVCVSKALSMWELYPQKGGNNSITKVILAFKADHHLLVIPVCLKGPSACYQVKSGTTFFSGSKRRKESDVIGQTL